MILSGLEIEKHLGRQIYIEPFSREQLCTNSYNLRLHNELLIYENQLLNVKIPNPVKIVKIYDNGFTLWPGKVYLARTIEHTRTFYFAPMVEARSSISRLGISVNASASLGSAGFEGYWTLQLSCIQPVKIYAGIEICQISYHTLQGKYESYNGRYQKNTGIQSSLVYKDFPTVSDEI